MGRGTRQGQRKKGTRKRSRSKKCKQSFAIRKKRVQGGEENGVKKNEEDISLQVRILYDECYHYEYLKDGNTKLLL